MRARSCLEALLRSQPFTRTCVVMLFLVVALVLPFVSLLLAPDIAGTALVLRQSLRVPILEVSAFGARPREPGSILVLGDKTSLMAEIFEDKEGLQTDGPHDLAPSLGITLPACEASRSKACRQIMENTVAQWEAAAFDTEGRLWALQENTQSIHVLSSDLRRLEQVIPMRFQPPAATASETRRRMQLLVDKGDVEGLVLLNDGHVLVAHQSNPPAILELAPRDESPLGWSAAPAAAATTLPQELIPIAGWELPNAYAKCTLNELVSDAAGQLNVLSSSCKSIFVLEGLKKGSKTARIARTLQLPPGIMKPEALAVLASGEYLVGDDAALPGLPNVHVLEEESLLRSGVGPREAALR